MMTKKSIIFGAFILGFSLSAQTGKVGINTTTPQEILDINGTARVRDLPIDGATNALYNGAATKTTTFTATAPVLIDANGNLGKAANKDLVPNSGATGFTATDASTAMFVIRRYSVTDWPSGQNSGAGFDTGMSTTKWEAVMSNVSYQFSNRHRTSNDSSAANTQINLFLSSLFGSEISATPKTIATFGWTLGKSGSTWRVIGDFASIQEQATPVDILFINKNYVATDRP